MKFALFSLVESVIGASCSILSPKGCTDMIIKDIYDIGNQTRNIGCIAASIEPNCVFTMLKLHSAANELAESMNKVGQAINSSCPSLELGDTLPLVPVFESLVPTVTRSMDIIQNKIGIFDHALLGVISLSRVVHNDLVLALNGANAMGYAIRGRVPTAAASIVDKLLKDLLGPIQSAQDAYAK